jgi:hypothetical protein
MGFRSALTAIDNGPFQYRAGPSTLGVGSENLALVAPGPPPMMNFQSPRYDPRRSIDVKFNTFPQDGTGKLPYYDYRHNGVYMHGEFNLTGLIEGGK